MNTWGTFNVAIPMATDSYKAGHCNQYPAGTEYVGSYMESRGSKLADVNRVSRSPRRVT